MSRRRENKVGRKTADLDYCDQKRRQARIWEVQSMETALSTLIPISKDDRSLYLKSESSSSKD